MVSAMILSLDAEDARVRANAARYIGDHARVDSDAIKALEKLCELALEDDDKTVRRESTRAIGRVLEADLTARRSELDEILVYDDRTSMSLSLREYVYLVLDYILRGDECPNVRSTAAWALGFADPSNYQEAASILLKALRDVDWDVRSCAACSLGKIGDHAVLGELARLAFDPRETKGAALSAFLSMREITRRLCGLDS